MLLTQVNHVSFLLLVFHASPCLMPGDTVDQENGGTFFPSRELDNAANVKE